MYQAKRGWKKVTNPKILKVYEECFDEARRLGYWQGDDLPLYSSKTTRALGTCHWHRRSDGKYDKAIPLSEYLLPHEPEKLRNTIVHEIAHATCSTTEHHGATWHSRANKIGAKWGLKIGRVSREADLCETLRKHQAKRENNYRYEVFCPHCNAVWKYKTKCAIVKNPGRYRCGKCKQDLKSREI